jgi:hypothetical protein
MMSAGEARPSHSSGTPHVVRAPLSLRRIRWDEPQDTVTWSSSPSGYFKGRQRRYSSLDVIAQLTLRIPPRGRLLVRRYGLYSRSGNLEGSALGRAAAPPGPQIARARRLVRQEGSR